MSIEALRCKVCGGLLNEKLKCQHCGTLHIRDKNEIEILKVCSKHSIGYSSDECPKCREEKENELVGNCLARCKLRNGNLCSLSLRKSQVRKKSLWDLCEYGKSH